MLFGFVTALFASSAVASTSPVREIETVPQQIERRIDEEMYYPAERLGRRETGFVHVSFELDARGMPTKINLAKRSHWPALNGAARATIGRIGPIVGAQAGAQFVAVLQYDKTTADGVLKKKAELAREAARVAKKLKAQAG